MRGLVADGYTVIDADDDEDNGGIFQEVKAASNELYADERRAIAASEDITDAQLKKLQNQRAKTPAERHQQRKAELSRRYEVEVTPDFVEKDDDGCYPQLRLHYYLTLGRQFLTKRDSKRAKAQAEVGENAIWDSTGYEPRKVRVGIGQSFSKVKTIINTDDVLVSEKTL